MRIPFDAAKLEPSPILIAYRLEPPPTGVAVPSILVAVSTCRKYVPTSGLAMLQICTQRRKKSSNRIAGVVPGKFVVDWSRFFRLLASTEPPVGRFDVRSGYTPGNSAWHTTGLFVGSHDELSGDRSL